MTLLTMAGGWSLLVLEAEPRVRPRDWDSLSRIIAIWLKES